MDPHSLSNFQKAEIRHIDFELEIDFKTRTLRGQARYQFDRPVLGRITLDTHSLGITHAEALGKPLPWSLEPASEILGQGLALDFQTEASECLIRFETSPQANALQWLSPAQTAGEQHPFLFSQCQSIHARSIFPCQDTPGVRFTFSAVVQVPAPLMAVMAAAPGEAESGETTNTFKFDMPQPVPTYLFAIAAGNLTARDISPRCRIYAEPESIDAAAWEFAETEASIMIAEELFGPYAWERYDMLLMPPSFPYGGMENPRLNFLTPTLLAGDRSLTTVVVHELAHSWTGNLVTNATWADFWLNEGWTVYGERRILERQYGPEIAKLASGLGYQQLMRGMAFFGEDTDGTRLVSEEVSENPDRPNFLVPYEKGYAFLSRIEQEVGREVFDPFILKYMETFRFRSITTDAFLAFLKQEIPGIERQLDLVEWIHGLGMPEDTPVFESELLGQVTEAVEAFIGGGDLPGREVNDWHPSQIDLFLRMLPETLTAEQAENIYRIFALQESQNYENLASFYPLAIQSGYKTILPRVEALLDSIGRIKLIGLIYLALAQTEWSRDLARPLFERCRAGYHPIADKRIDQILTETGV